MPPSPDDHPEAATKPFLQHLEDLRRALIWCAVALFTGMAAAGVFAPLFFRLLKRPLTGVVPNPDTFLLSLDVTGGLSVAMQTILWGGLLFSAPVILLALCWFIFPGLTRPERRMLLGALLLAALLFMAGVTLCYLMAIGPAISMMLRVNDWLGIRVDYFTVTSYIGFVLKLMLGFGLTFELPILLLLLGQLGIIHSRQLRDKRRHAIVLILILSALITPTQDPFSLMILAIPLVMLYELCIWLLWVRERRREQ